MLEDEGEAYFYTVYEDEKIVRMLFANDDTVYDLKPTDIFLKAFSTNRAMFTHNIKPFHKAVNRVGGHGKAIALDTLLAAYLLNPSASEYDVLRLAGEYGVAIPEDEDKAVMSAAAMLCSLQKATKRN